MYLNFIVCDENEVRAVSCDDESVMWRVEKGDNLDPGRSLYIPSRNAILVIDRRKNCRVVILHPGTELEMQSIPLPDYDAKLKWLCLVNDQIVVGGQDFQENRLVSSYFSVK